MFCAYMYLRKNGTPYYVGKGDMERPYSKNRTIPQPPDRERILVFPRASEQEAFDTEKELIRNWGRKDLGMGILWNFTDGGEGAAGVIQSNQKRDKCRKAAIGNKRGSVPCSLEKAEQIATKQRGIKRGPNPKIKAARSKQVITEEQKAAISEGLKRAYAEGRRTVSEAQRQRVGNLNRRAA